MRKKLCIKNISIEWILIFVFLGFIFAVGFYRLDEQYAPIILMDEFGYWGNAAFFSGRDWSSINQFNNYYSYGYSLILSILIRIFASTGLLYKTAILLNAVFLCITLLLLIQIGKFLFPTISRLWIIVYSFITVFYPSYFANMHIAWDETLLVLNYVLCLYFLTRILAKDSYLNIILFTLTLILCYVTHQRGLGVLFFGCITLLLLWWNKNINWKKIICFAISLLLLFCLHKYIKTTILNDVFLSATNASAVVNDYGSIWGHILTWFNLAGAKKLLVSIIGKTYYLLIGSCGLFGLAVYYMLCSESNWIQNLKSKKLSNKQISCFFLLTSFTATILISSIYTLDAWRLDVVVYGRYTEWALAPFILIGMLAIVQEEKKMTIPYLIIVVITILMLCFIAKNYESHPEWTLFYDVCSFVMAYFRDICQLEGYSFLYLACALECAYMIIISGISRLKKVKIYLSIFILCSSLPISYWCVQRVFDSNYRSEDCLKMNEYIKDTEEPVYFINDYGQGIWYVADIQVLNPDIEIHNISGEELENVIGYVFLGTSDAHLDDSYVDDVLVSNSLITLMHLEN